MNFNGVIGEFTTSGQTVNASLISGLYSTGLIAVSGTNLFFANYEDDRIGEYTTSGATVSRSLIPGSELEGPVGIAISGTNLFVSLAVNNTIGEYTTSGATVNGSLISGLDRPYGIAISPEPPGVALLGLAIGALWLWPRRKTRAESANP